MKVLSNVYAVVQVFPDNEKLCSTYNATHDAWMPALFQTEEGATKFYEQMLSIKTFEKNEYRILQVGVVK